MAVWSGVKCESYGDHPSSSAPNPTGASYIKTPISGLGWATPLHYIVHTITIINVAYIHLFN